MWPKLKQFMKWSLPAKYSFLGVPLTIIGIAISLVALYFTLYPEQSNVSALIKQEYTPNVRLVDVKPTQWIGDEEEFLTLFVENQSKGPATNFNITFWDKDKPLTFSKSKSSNVFDGKSISIKGNQKIGIPLSPMSEFKKYLAEKYSEGEIVGFGLKPQIPDSIKSELDSKYLSKGNGGYSTNSYSVVVKLDYEGIMDTSTVTAIGIYIYVDRTVKS